VIRTTPFHARTSALNQTGLWSHWSGFLAATKYQMSEKFEYFAVRNSAGLFDTSPLYKYRIEGRDAESFLAGVLARDIRKCQPGRAQYTLWCDDRGFVIEDGVVFRHSENEFLLTAAEPQLGYFADLIGSTSVEMAEVTEDYAALAIQGPTSRDILATVAPEVANLSFFALTPSKIGGVPVTISRTGYTGDLGFEIWVEADHAVAIWDAVAAAGEGRGVIPFGLTALQMARIEAGLVLLDVDFESSRFAWNDEQRSTPVELGFGWMFRRIEDDDRAFIGGSAIRRELAEGASRYKLMGLLVDWQDYDRTYSEAGLISPKDHIPTRREMMLYDSEGGQAGYATSFMYSPILQRHIAIARVTPELATPGSRAHLEVTINHSYATVAAEVTRLPLYNPDRKTA
jgi:aminomethyltransferase